MSIRWRWAVLVSGVVILGGSAAPPLARALLARPVVASSRLGDPPRGDAARGRALGTAVLVCAECHGADLGGQGVVDSFGFARAWAPNLTRGAGGLGRPTLEQWDLAIRHGVGRDGRALVLMPADGYAHLRVDELCDLVAWLEALPAVDRPSPGVTLGPFGVLALLTGGLHVPAWTIDHQAVPRAGDRPLGRGAALLQLAGCAGCHGPALAGRAMGPGLPDAPSLVRTGDATWGLAEFRRGLQLGLSRDGGTLEPLMPWRAFAAWPPEDVEAVWNALPISAPGRAAGR